MVSKKIIREYSSHTLETKKKMRQSKLAEKNPNWKGDNISYSGIHSWIKRNKKRPVSEICEFCKKSKGMEWVNLSNKYKRDFSDWKWGCRRCHMLSDGRINNLKRTATYNFGSKNGQAKLNEEKVKEIKKYFKEDKLSNLEIAKLYGLSDESIANIRNNKTWVQVKCH